MSTQELINLRGFDNTQYNGVSASELLVTYGDCLLIGEQKCYWSIGKTGLVRLQSSCNLMQVQLDWLKSLYLINGTDGGVVSLGERQAC
ncbi:MAG: hypothetical protein GY881_08210 [Gammaproteobacteria bacterium]|nr:hypothetical protein [Gammaproteobacteria bacterium]MCP4880306.1 hypothetical protein [Gammaproteobacteria bacterium]MDP6166656.1 hypothetical protein [Gammaproteobacteria bacterium]